MFSTFEKRTGCPINAWELARRKVCSAPKEFSFVDERSKNSKARLHSRSSGHAHRHSLPILPTIQEPDARRVSPKLSLDENMPASRNGQLRLHVKKWRKTGLSRSRTSSTHFEPLECFRRIARMVTLVIRVSNALRSDPKMGIREGICKYFLEIMDAYTITKERTSFECRKDVTGFLNEPLVFDPKFYKANKEVKISKEVKQILSSRPENRTSDQLQTLLYALQTLESFSELPLHMQQDVCKVAWLQSLPSNKIIIQQDRVPENFYFVITGTGVACKKCSARCTAGKPEHFICNEIRATVLSENDPTRDSLFTSLTTLKKGSSFGETAILRNCRRTATVISKDPIQLLVISKEDYQRIFMGHTNDGQEPAYLTFCRSLDFLADWPVDLLLDNQENCLFHYFRRGTVIVKDSNESDWLYVIVSGACQVVLALEITKPRLRGNRPEKKSTADKLGDLTENRHRKSAYSRSRTATPPAFLRSNTEDKLMKNLPSVFPVTNIKAAVPRSPKKQTAFVQLELLHPRSVFGLWTLLNFEQDHQATQQASVSLVSRSAECVMISKKFFMAQASELTKMWIRRNVRSYPSKETLQRNLQERINWEAYKQNTVQSVINRS